MHQARNHSACPKGDIPRGENRVQLYDEVTAKIIAQLEAGRFPWVQPWGRPQGSCSGQGSGLAPALPHNALTGRAYSGVNVLLLWGSVSLNHKIFMCDVTVIQGGYRRLADHR